MPHITCNSIETASTSASPAAFAGGVHIWLINIPASAGAALALDALLTIEEHRRAAAYHRPRDRERFIVSRVALRQLLGRLTGRQPASITFQIGSNKKPSVYHSGQELHFNVSHSKDLVVIAVADKQVGIDIEAINPAFEFQSVLTSCFSNAEQMAIMQAADTSAMFYTLWTRKEALLKATGKGIDDDMPLVPVLDGRHFADVGAIGSELSWAVDTCTIAPGYVCSVAADGGSTGCQCHPFVIDGP